jgi:hypothetical protein
MGWVKPIDTIELEFRRRGVFLLVDVSRKKLCFYGYKKDSVEINQMMDQLRGCSHEMENFLIARAQARANNEGETT